MNGYAWTQAVEYLVSHAGRWVSGFEIGDHVYRGQHSPKAPGQLIYRARKAGIPIESSPYGYRIGRQHRLTCRQCGALMVRYPDGEMVCYSCVGSQYIHLEFGRTPYAEGTRQRAPWSEEDRAFVLTHQSDMSLAELGAAISRTPAAVRGFLKQHSRTRKPYVRRKA